MTEMGNRPVGVVCPTLPLETGESIYIDSSMGHAYLAGEGCEEAVTIAVMSAQEDDLMDSLIHIHGERTQDEDKELV